MVQKLGAEIFFFKIRFWLFYDKKSSMAIKPEGGGGGGKALMARPLREEFFFETSLIKL